MDISFSVDRSNGIPIYIQIMDRIKHMIATGILKPGQQLPTIREMAVNLTINLHTVSHAYAELEREGVLTVQRGRGTFITDDPHANVLEDMRETKLKAIIDQMFVEAMNLGYDHQEIGHALESYLIKKTSVPPDRRQDGKEPV